MGGTLSCLTKPHLAVDDADAEAVALAVAPAADREVRWRGWLEKSAVGAVDRRDLVAAMPPAFRVEKGRLEVLAGSRAERDLADALSAFGEGQITDSTVRNMLLEGARPDALSALGVLIKYHLIDITRPTERARDFPTAGRLQRLFRNRIPLLHFLVAEGLEAAPGSVVSGQSASLSERIRVLAEAGVDLDHRAHSGITPLMLGAARGSLAAVRALLENGADPYATDHAGLTALHWAARMGEPQVLELLAQKGVPIEWPDKNGWTALHWASAQGRAKPDDNAAADDAPDTIATLANLGADLNARTHSDASPLLLAVRKHHPHALRALINAGADVELRHQPDQSTALHEAARLGAFNEAEVLLEVGRADPNATNVEGYAPLHFAGRLFPGDMIPRLDLAAALLAAGAEIDLRALDGVRPVDFAGRQGNDTVFNLLVAHNAAPPHRLLSAGLDP